MAKLTEDGSTLQGAYAVARSRALAPLFYSAECPPSREAFQYQSAGVEFALQRNHAVFGDAPGVGKSAECIFLDNAIRSKRTLVICPASLRLNWEREVWMWSMKENVEASVVHKANDGIDPDRDFVITSYDMLRNASVFEAICDIMWDHVILDEAHYLKDPKGNRRTQAVCAPDGLAGSAGRFTLATGTLLPNQPSECYNTIRLLDWEAINKASLEDFMSFYYDYGSGIITVPKVVGGVRRMVRQHSNMVRNVPMRMDDLQYRLRSKIMVRRLKEDVLPQLPPKQWHVFPLQQTAGIKRVLKSDAWQNTEKLYLMDSSAFDSEIPIDGAVSTARRELGEAKAPLIVEYIEELLNEGVEKLVIGAWHHTVMDYMAEALERFGIVFMSGATSPTKKQWAVDQFQTNPEVRIILGQMIPLGEGWTLTAAQDVILAEPYWVPGKNDQLFDRVHRIGQEAKSVICHVPVVPDSLDEKILANVIEKDQNIYLALDHQD